MVLRKALDHENMFISLRTYGNEHQNKGKIIVSHRKWGICVSGYLATNKSWDPFSDDPLARPSYFDLSGHPGSELNLGTALTRTL